MAFDHSFITFEFVIITNPGVIMRKGAVQKMLQSRGLVMNQSYMINLMEFPVVNKRH